MNYSIVALFLCCALAASQGEDLEFIANQGEVASEGEFPYMVSIQLNRQHHCGGALISNTHVLTAAHCVYEDVDRRQYVSPITVEVGSTTIGQGTTYQVKRVSYYPQYGKLATQANDIAMVHLASPVATSATVGTINLPAANQTPPVGTQVLLSGFGNAVVNGPVSPVLKKMDATVRDHQQCAQYFLQSLNIGVSDDKICAARQPGYGACQGDSGGPLVDATKSTIIGVVSGGNNQCSDGNPDLYTDVSLFVSYINSELNYPASGNQNPAVDLIST